MERDGTVCLAVTAEIFSLPYEPLSAYQYATFFPLS
jgi:hypothetical protein